MEIHGKNIIGSSLSAVGEKTFSAYDPRAGSEIEQRFVEATTAEVEKALDLADSAARRLRQLTSDQVVDFLTAIREEVRAIGDELITTAGQETGLDSDRLKGERERTLNQ